MKKRILAFALIAAAVLIAAAAVVVFYRPARVWVKDKINFIMPDKCDYKIYYQNNKLVYNYRELDFDNADVREIQVGKDRKYLVNHSRGFAVGAFGYTARADRFGIFDIVLDYRTKN